MLFARKRRKSQQRNEIQNEKFPLDPSRIPAHVAIIMDGNGRWAKQRGLPRSFGHKAGAQTVTDLVRSASELGIQVVTVYAFSNENWTRPEEEVHMLMELFIQYLEEKTGEMDENNIRLMLSGDLDRMSDDFHSAYERTRKVLEGNTGLIFNIAINYGGRQEIVMAAKSIARKVCSGELNLDDIDEQTISDHLYTAGLPDPDLVIRTSGEYRLSNFLLYQSSYAELYFPDVYWPDFNEYYLRKSIYEYQQRNRRFGNV